MTNPRKRERERGMQTMDRNSIRMLRASIRAMIDTLPINHSWNLARVVCHGLTCIPFFRPTEESSSKNSRGSQAQKRQKGRGKKKGKLMRKRSQSLALDRIGPDRDDQTFVGICSCRTPATRRAISYRCAEPFCTQANTTCSPRLHH